MSPPVISPPRSKATRARFITDGLEAGGNQLRLSATDEKKGKPLELAFRRGLDDHKEVGLRQSKAVAS
jgi:hypothetical protein